MTLRFRRFLIALLSVPSLIAAAGDAPSFAPRVEQWGVQELTLRSQRTYNNPFTDASIQARFRSQGKDIAVDGFYDGNHTWKVRFMPEASGTWTFTTVSADPDLGGKSGSFVVDAPSSGNHGPVVVHHQRHFAYADGTPYFLLGTTLYNWLNRDPDLENRTLATLSRNPFNKVRFLVFPKWMVFNRVAPARFPYLQPQPGKFDLDRFDPEFFAHYESRIRDLEALGIEADIILFHPYDKWGFSTMDERHDDAYLRYVVARFAAFRNIWWTLANEFDVFPVQKDWRHLGELLAKIDPYGHQRGIHNCCTAFYDNSQSWITHVILQDITAQQRTASSRNDSSVALDARKIGKPVVVDEYGYEGNNGMTWGNLGPREAVELHWAIAMAGAYGSHGETYVNPGHLLWWSVGGELVGAAPARLGFLKKIMSGAPYSDMEPAPDLVTSGNPLITALAKRGSYYLFHFAQAKEAADWNIGFFGPATPSRPLPAKPIGPGTWKPVPVPEFRIGEGTFRVDMIDSWNMKVYFLGYTTGPVQKFQPQIAPGLMRFVKVERAEPGKPVGSVTELMNEFGSHAQ
ncbi:MAG: DUF5060 domain-containing protein [Bryobacteraceae bacterium]|jgi:hypothetical protein